MVTNGFEGECSNYGRTQEDGGWRTDGWMDGWIGKYARKGVGLCIPYFMHVRRETINYAFERWKGVRRM